MSTQALSAPISSLSLLLVQTQAARSKAATPEQLTSAHLYLDMAKSGYLFHAVGNVMCIRTYTHQTRYPSGYICYHHYLLKCPAVLQCSQYCKKKFVVYVVFGFARSTTNLIVCFYLVSFCATQCHQVIGIQTFVYGRCLCGVGRANTWVLWQFKQHVWCSKVWTLW